MLSLSRMVGEEIIIDLSPKVLRALLEEGGCRGRVCVSRVAKGQVRLAFDFPKCVPVLRKEIEGGHGKVSTGGGAGDSVESGAQSDCGGQRPGNEYT